jgi:hypothetical protein
MKSIKVITVVALVLMVAGLVLGTGCGTQGPQGPAGVGIESVVNNGDGTFTLLLTDGWSFTTDNLTGPKGDTGATGATGQQGVQGPAGQGYSPMQIALLRWYEANQTGISYVVGSDSYGPYGICFDGANVWVTNQYSNIVSKL